MKGTGTFPINTFFKYRK